jgi:hypothetical protein
MTKKRQEKTTQHTTQNTLVVLFSTYVCTSPPSLGCASLFALGIQSLNVVELYQLWRCLELHDVVTTSMLMVGNEDVDSNEALVACIAARCKREFLRCEIDFQCVGKQGHPNFKVCACVCVFCGGCKLTPSPSSSL